MRQRNGKLGGTSWGKRSWGNKYTQRLGDLKNNALGVLFVCLFPHARVQSRYPGTQLDAYSTIPEFFWMVPPSALDKPKGYPGKSHPGEVAHTPTTPTALAVTNCRGGLGNVFHSASHRCTGISNTVSG